MPALELELLKVAVPETVAPLALELVLLNVPVAIVPLFTLLLSKTHEVIVSVSVPTLEVAVPLPHCIPVVKVMIPSVAASYVAVPVTSPSL